MWDISLVVFHLGYFREIIKRESLLTVREKLMFKTVIWALLLWVSQVSIQAQSQLDWLLEQPKFETILKNHLHEVRGSGYSTVSALLFKPNAGNLTVYLTAYTYLTEAKDHLPTSFSIVNSQPFLIYDGSELLISDKTGWFETVKTFIAGRLCDDLTYRELLKQPGPKELRVPCGFIYEPPIQKLIFKNRKLIKREVVSEVPYYLK